MWLLFANCKNGQRKGNFLYSNLGCWIALTSMRPVLSTKCATHQLGKRVYQHSGYQKFRERFEGLIMENY